MPYATHVCGELKMRLQCLESRDRFEETHSLRRLIRSVDHISIGIHPDRAGAALRRRESAWYTYLFHLLAIKVIRHLGENERKKKHNSWVPHFGPYILKNDTPAPEIIAVSIQEVRQKR